MRATKSAHEQQLQTDGSSRTLVYREPKSGYQLEAYSQQCSNRHLRRITAQFRTGSHWLNIETRRHKQPQVPRDDRLCPMCSFKIIRPPGLEHFDAFDADDERPDPIETEHHAIFACPGYASARKAFQDLFADDVATVGQFFAQHDCDRIAKFLTEIKFLRSCLV